MEFLMDYREIRHALEIAKAVTAVKGSTGGVLPAALWMFNDGLCTVIACNQYSAAEYRFRVPDMPMDFECKLVLANFEAPKTKDVMARVEIDATGLLIHLDSQDIMAKPHPEGARFPRIVDIWNKTDRDEPRAVVSYDRKMLLMLLKSIKHQGGKKAPDTVDFYINRGGDLGATTIVAGNEERFIMPLRKPRN